MLSDEESLFKYHFFGGKGLNQESRENLWIIIWVFKFS